MSDVKVNRLSALAVLVGKTEQEVLKEKTRDEMMQELQDKTRLHKLKKTNKHKENAIENLKVQVEKLKNKIAIKDSEIESLRNEVFRKVHAITARDHALTNFRAKLHSMHQERDFIYSRIVAMYGNKALLDILNHVENPIKPEDVPTFKEKILKWKPIY